MAKKPPHPFIKWAGGKTRVAPHVLRRLPEKTGTYYEPMVGGGAIFLELARSGRFEKAVIADLNPELIVAWTVMRDDVEKLIKELKKAKYQHDKDRYEAMRALDRTEAGLSALEDVERAARFIYLNKTCFNGLYRVNQAGQFNVPFGKYKDPVICDPVNFRAVSKVVQGCEILMADFEEASKGAGRGDAVYFDPPYIPISKTSSFTGYTKGGFDLGEHGRLAKVFGRLAKKGARVVLSNSSAKEAEGLYAQYDVDWITDSRSVGGPADYRKKAVKEIVAFSGPRV